ncbi:MAG: YdcF family protein [Lachnospiraceae bacterium]|jgi:uncharacterized SAM-binding protein YcdF (DUF218 family)
MIADVLIEILPTLILCGIFAWSMHKDRSRYRNIILLDLAAVSLAGLLIAAAGQAGEAVMLVLAAVLFLLFLIFPFFLIYNGFVMMKREGHGLANLLSLLLGVLLLAGELAGFLFLIGAYLQSETLVRFLDSMSPVIIFIIVTAGYVSFVFLSFMFYCIFLQWIPHTRDFDYVIIHGAGLKPDGTVTKLLADRCDKAIEVYRKDPTPPVLVPSGGQGADEAVSEAQAMTAYLTSQGIPGEKILQEDRSTTTLENIRYSRDLIKAQPGRHKTALVTSNYHVYRAMRYARRVGLDAVGIGAHVAFYYWPSALIRECIAVHSEKKHLIIFLAGYLVLLVPALLISIFHL